MSLVSGNCPYLQITSQVHWHKVVPTILFLCWSTCSYILFILDSLLALFFFLNIPRGLFIFFSLSKSQDLDSLIFPFIYLFIYFLHLSFIDFQSDQCDFLLPADFRFGLFLFCLYVLFEGHPHFIWRFPAGGQTRAVATSLCHSKASSEPHLRPSPQLLAKTQYIIQLSEARFQTGDLIVASQLPFQ